MKLSESVHRKDNSKKTHFKTNTLLALLSTQNVFPKEYSIVLLPTFHEPIKLFYEFDVICNLY